MAKNLVKQLVVSFGFLNGIWFSIGMDPQTVILKFLQPFVMQMPNPVKIIFTIIPIILTILTIITLVTIYARGGILGSAAVVLAFFAGAILFRNPIIGIILLIIAYVLGIITIKNKR